MVALWKSRLDERRLLPFHIYAMVECLSPDGGEGVEKYEGHRFTVRYSKIISCALCFQSVLFDLTVPRYIQFRSVKLFADGALGSWGAAMLEPYSGKCLPVFHVQFMFTVSNPP
jgi:hypothetical protein